MKDILITATGGTIASKDIDSRLVPAIDADRLMTYIPECREKCNVKGLSIMNVDSTNMNPQLISKIAEAVYDNYKEYDAFVITHGTDTMAYSAAALSYMLKNLSKPVILTGSQLPIEAHGTDAIKNLSDAIHFASEGVCGVYIVFGGAVISGTHAVKMKTKSFDAFMSVNCDNTARIENGNIVYNRTYNTLENVNNDFYIDTKMCQNIINIRMFPGIETKIFDYIKDNYRGVIIEAFGMGGIPNNDNDVVSKIHELAENGIAVVITTQCMYEGVNLDVYEVAKELSGENIIVANDMTTESITMKLMWALAHFNNIKDIKRYMENEDLFRS